MTETKIKRPERTVVVNLTGPLLRKRIEKMLRETVGR